MRTTALIAALGAMAILSPVLLAIADARERYLERGAPAGLAIEATPGDPWAAISELPPLDMGNAAITNAVQATNSQPVIKEEPAFTEAPAAASISEPAAPAVPEPTAGELLSQLRTIPGDTNTLLPTPLSFVPPSRPSSTATYSKTK